MKAIVGERYGPPDVLELREVDEPLFREFRRVFTPHARGVAVGARCRCAGIGPLKHIIGTRLTALGRSQKVINFVSKITKDDLEAMRELLEAGAVRSVIDRRYELREVPEALRHLRTGHARGKVVIVV
jgi:NADPH:quinone reductase-like Zn-dependent oxidoreductase